MFTLKLPKDQNELTDLIAKQEQIAQTPSASPQYHTLLELMLKCVNKQPFQRPNALYLKEVLDSIPNSSSFYTIDQSESSTQDTSASLNSNPGSDCEDLYENQ